jgi:hypothetical protein
MISRRFESGLTTRPGCSARPATAILRRVGWGTHSRTAVVPSDSALHPLAVGRRGSSQQIIADLFTIRNLPQNERRISRLNCVPRQYGSLI